LNRLTGGDGGIDIFGNYKGYLVLVQCKNYTTASVGVGIIRAFEGVMSKYPKKSTIGILVISAANRYTRPAIRRVKLSNYNILLTSFSTMSSDIPYYLIGKFNDDNIDEKIKELKNSIDELSYSQKKIEGILEENKEKFNQVEKIESELKNYLVNEVASRTIMNVLLIIIAVLLIINFLYR